MTANINKEKLRINIYFDLSETFIDVFNENCDNGLRDRPLGC